MSRSQISTPGNLSFHDWVSDLNNSLPTFNIPIPPPRVENWKKWVFEFIQLNPSINVTLPDSANFAQTDDWKKWAYLFLQDMNTF